MERIYSCFSYQEREATERDQADIQLTVLTLHIHSIDMADVGAARRAMLFRMPRRRRTEPVVAASCGRRKRMAVARLGGGGGGGGPQWRRFLGALRRVRVRCLAAMYCLMLRRLRANYAKALRELNEGVALLTAPNQPSVPSVRWAMRM
jgi:hypothetical protein